MGIIESVQQYDLNIPAGGAQAIDVAGDRVQFLSAVDPFAQIEIRPNFAQGNISLKPGQGFKFSQQVTRWVVFNRGAVPLSGYLLIGSGDFFDQRIAGTVDVIDGAKARTLANQAFLVPADVTAHATNLSVAQLWNPVGSGKNLVVETLNVGAGAATLAGFGWNTSALANVYNQGGAKLLGGAASVAQSRWAQTASSAATGGLGTITVQASDTKQVPLREPIIVPPGYGLMVWTGGANIAIRALFEFFEEIA